MEVRITQNGQLESKKRTTLIQAMFAIRGSELSVMLELDYG